MSRVGSKKRVKVDDPYEKLVAEYRQAGNVWPTTSSAIAKWALDNNRAVYSRLWIVPIDRILSSFGGLSLVSNHGV